MFHCFHWITNIALCDPILSFVTEAGWRLDAGVGASLFTGLKQKQPQTLAILKGN